MPKLDVVSDKNGKFNTSINRNSQDEVDKAFNHDDEPRSVHAEGSSTHHREPQMVLNTGLAAEIGNEARDNTSGSNAAESAAQIQPAGQIARSQT